MFTGFAFFFQNIFLVYTLGCLIERGEGGGRLLIFQFSLLKAVVKFREHKKPRPKNKLFYDTGKFISIFSQPLYLAAQ